MMAHRNSCQRSEPAILFESSRNVPFSLMVLAGVRL